MNQIRGIVIATLLAVWCFPAVSSARTPAESAPQVEQVTAVTNGPSTAAGDDQTTSLATREARARALQNFRGGGVYIYVGSGVLLVAVVVLLIVLLV
ncbi:MAG TPA: hypothetical protein VI456_16695 [Polyangia bacterium]